MSTKGESDIEGFYAGKTIFITGGTGFLGKVLLEKLLRSCPRVKRVYLLVRSKKNVLPEQRIDELLGTKLFDQVRETGMNLSSKVKAVTGDISETMFGLSDEDRQTLQEEVEIVFHSAATVRFVENLKTALQMNVQSVAEMISLVRGMKKLQAFVHVSSAYSNCDKGVIEEKIYPTDVEPETLLKSTDWMDEAMISSLTPHVIGQRPNTYTFTKSLAEHIIQRDAADLPVAIFRPSIIGASVREPVAGWVDNFNGPSGVFVAAGKGMLRSMVGNIDAVADIVPVDTCSNMMIAIAWQTASKRATSNNNKTEIPVYHCTTGELKPYTWGELANHLNMSLTTYPLNRGFRRPNFGFESRRLLNNCWAFVSHTIPAYIADGFLLASGKKRKVSKMYKRIDKMTETLYYFTENQWQFKTGNYLALLEDMSPHDREVFDFDVRNLDWGSYMESTILGIKQFLLKEDLADLPKAQMRIRKLRNIRWAFYALPLVALSSWILLKKSKIPEQLEAIYNEKLLSFVQRPFNGFSFYN